MSFSLGELYHDTLGLPLQVLLRTGRAIRDPNISLWDRKGLLDPDLIPGVNLLFNTGDDATAKDLGIQNPWAQFAVETALDPITYLTAGLSASGKAARAVNMAFNGQALQAAAKAGALKAESKIGDFAKLADQAIRDGTYGSANELRALQKVSGLGDEFKDMGFQELLGHAKDRELMVAVPGLTKFGASFSVRTQHRSWFSLAGSSVGSFYRTAYAASGIRQIPGVRGALQRTEKAYDAFATGLRRPTGPVQRIKPAGSVLDADDATEAMEMLLNGRTKDAELDGWAKKLHEKVAPRLDSLGKDGVTATFEKEIARGRPVEAAFLKALGIRVPSAAEKAKTQARAYLRVLSGSPDAAFPATGRELEGMAARFRGDYGYAGQILKDSEVREVLAPMPAFPESEAKYFRAGSEVRRVWNKLFRSDLGPEALLPADKALRSWEAASSEMVQQQAKLLYRARPLIAREVFGGTADPVGNFDRAVRNYFEARFEPELLSGLADDITSEGGALRFRKNLSNFLSRAKTNTAVLSKLLRLKDPEGSLPGLLRVMDERTGDFPAITHMSREVERQALPAPEALGLLGNGAPVENAVRSSADGPFLGHLGDQELAMIVSRETLSAKDLAVQNAAASLLEYRQAGLAAQIEKAAPITNEPTVPLRSLEGDFLGTALTEGGRQQSGPLEEAYMKLISFQTEYADWTRRTKKAGYAVNPSPAVWRQFEEAASQWNAALDDIMGKGLGKSGADYFASTQTIQRRVAEHGIRSGLLTDGHYPLGYLPRISSGAVQRAMRELGNEIPDDVRGVLTPQVGQEFARSLDALTLDQVNELHGALLKQKRPELAAKLAGILERDGLKLSVLEDDPATAFLTALGNAESAENTAAFTNRVLGDSKAHTLAGRVVGYWQKDGGEVKFGTGSKVVGKVEGRKLTARLGAREQAEVPYTAILLETDKGVVSVPTAMLDKGFRFMHLGAIGGDAGTAFAHRAARGNLTAAVHAGENLNTPTLASMAGDWAVIGTDSHLGALANSVTSQQTAFADAMRLVDASNHFLRKWQTVYRPAFHAANVVSGGFQGMILGTSLRNTIGGHLDAARMLFGGGAELATSNDRMAALLGESRMHQGGFGPPATVKRAIAFVEAARRIGPRGKPLSRAEMDAMGLDEIADLIIEGPQGERFSGTQILYAAARGELLGTFAARGFEGGSATTRAMLKERQLGERLAGPGRSFSKTTAKWQGATEISEVYSRMSALIGRLREGVPLETAVSEVKDAFVDYSQLTKFERSFLKRGLTYYTFARHYVPFFLKQVAQSPRAVGPWVHALESSGAFTTADGQVQLKAGNWRIAAQRLNANLDALMAAPALLESVTDVGRGAEDLVNDLQKPGFLTTGGLLGIITGSDALFHTDDRRPRKNWLEDAVMSTWASRWIAGAGRGLASAVVPGVAPPDFSPLEEAARLFLPAKEVGPKFEQRLVLKNYAILLAQIKYQAESTPSGWRRNRLAEEARDLRQSLELALKREGAGR